MSQGTPVICIMGFCGDTQYDSITRAVYPWSTHRWKLTRTGTPSVSVCEMCRAVKTVWNDITVIVTDERGNEIGDKTCELETIGDVMES